MFPLSNSPAWGADNALALTWMSASGVQIGPLRAVVKGHKMAKSAIQNCQVEDGLSR